MGVYDANPAKDSGHGREARTPWTPAEDPVVFGLSEQLSALDMGDPSNGGLFQVMRAMEDAESTIKQQFDENNHLREQLSEQARELEKYKLESLNRRASLDDLRDEPSMGSYEVHAANLSAQNVADKVKLMDHGSSMNSDGTLIVPRTGSPENGRPSLQPNARNHQYSDGIKVNGSLKVSAGLQNGPDSAGHSQFSTPSSRSISPSRHRREVEYDARFNLAGQLPMPVSEINSNILWKQDLMIKVKEHEEEISLLRKHLAEYSIKAFDQQQQDLVDAASKALSYRQDIIEENIRLTYALQASQQEKSTFVSSLLPILADYGLQPSVLDAQSIVSNLKILFRHLQENLIFTEEKLKESQYQLAPWRGEPTNITNLPLQSPSHPLGANLVSSGKGLEIVPQPAFSHAQSPVASPANTAHTREWEGLRDQNQQAIASSFATKNQDHNISEGVPISVNRNGVQNASASLNQDDPHAVQLNVESRKQNQPFKEVVRSNETDDSETSNLNQGRMPAVHWGNFFDKYVAYAAAEDDPLPAIEGLQISGEAFPGRELQACGYSINGTTSCNFEWVRYLEDGSVNYIEGAKQPKYLVTADDVDSYLAIEVHPLDDRKRKGELVKIM
ncbi:hypothetical protein HPP92_002676 [Vanilla planifolia]|uniref:AIR9-like A9 domain-containing protein n=1 Tax=Vanilla planifolia TaxID=51239 RepID=A0A835S6S5_VANPL|nr:hypothetical protein HPP92_002676 [Vanilla planifolia]